MGIKDAFSVSKELEDELNQAMRNPREMVGYADYGPSWPLLNELSGGLIPYSLGLLLARPKVGKSMLAASWLPGIAEQAERSGKVVRVITLEMRRKAYQRRVAAIHAGINDPMRIRKGKLTPQEEEGYRNSLRYIAGLPIEYLSNEDMTEEDKFLFGESVSIGMPEISRFVRDDTFWTLLDHIGLVAGPGKDTTDRIYRLANELQNLAQRKSAILVISHLTRASMGGGEPGLESIAGSDQLGRNADVIMLLWRPFFESRNLSPEEVAMSAELEPASLKVIARDEGGGRLHLVWDVKKARFSELDIPILRLPEKR